MHSCAANIFETSAWEANLVRTFHGIIREKFAEILANFTGFSQELLFGANFAKKQSVKNGGFCEIFSANFTTNQLLLQ